MQEEIWRDIAGYEGLYQISNADEDKIRSIYKEILCKKGGKRSILSRMMKFAISKDYKMISLTSNEGIRKSHSIHRLKALTFISNPENKPCVNHIDGNKQNNALSNLEWVTYSENTIHSVNIGTFSSNKGEQNASSILTEKEVLEMRRLYAAGVRQCDIRRKFGLSINTARSAIMGVTWKHI